MDMEKEIQILNIDDILPNRFQPRIQFSDKNINELADSIKEHGVIQPIVVRKISDKYEIIAGERRYKASILAGKTTIPAIITNLDDKNSAEIALIENVQRQDLTPIEEAVSYKKILDMGYINQTALADKLGKTQSTIANKLRLLNLHDDVQEALLDGKISERHARSLLKLEGQEQVNMLNRIINERLTVRQTDVEINKIAKTEPAKESEGMKMDDKTINEFNIPTTPIIEDIKEVAPVEPIVENHEQDINPGFMDIEKIENNAEDIFKPDELANMDQILEKPQVIENYNPMAPVMPVEPVNNESSNEEPSGGRFFSMFNFNKEEENPNYVSDIENTVTNLNFGEPASVPPTFNPFGIENESVTPENNIEDVKIEESPVVNTAEGLNLDSLNPAFNLDIEPTPVSPVEPVNVEPSTIEETKVDEQPFMQFNPYHLNDESDFTTKIPVITEDMINNTNIGETLNINSEPVQLFEEPKEEIPVVNTTEDLNLENINFDFNSNTNETFDQPSFVSPVEPVNIEPISMEEKVVEPFIQVEPTTKFASDFKMVINTIRNCAETIEKYGYKINTEEIDFENQYQVIFKIDKK